jgi:hypothetical protein
LKKKIVIRANITVFISLQKKESTENQTIGEELPLVGGKLIPSSSYKNQQTVLAFAKWKDFYSLHETEKLFYISVNFETKKTKIKISKSKKSPNLLTLNKAQIKEKQIKHLFKEDKWAQYFNSNIEELRFKIISKLINSDSPLPLIKLNLRLN